MIAKMVYCIYWTPVYGKDNKACVDDRMIEGEGARK